VPLKAQPIPAQHGNPGTEGERCLAEFEVPGNSVVAGALLQLVPDLGASLFRAGPGLFLQGSEFRKGVPCPLARPLTRPLARQHLTVEQWDKLGERGAKSIQDKRKRLLFLGMLLEETSPEEERNFMKNIPPPVRVLWKLIGRRQYAGYTRLIRSA